MLFGASTMQNGANVQQQATGHFPSNSPAFIYQPPPNEDQKRGRDGDGVGNSQAQHLGMPAQPTPQQAQAPASPPVSNKRSRPNNYEAARTVKPSILTALGSLAGGGQGDSNTTVPLRRRLSGGALDEFIGGHDNMDMDTTDSRPRSMSF
mmetsp:Transcript_115010/g.171897  ORF Transcript_115010/g.171897 Transcript_115010/m.171897 type:complete len:150 (+) Transcript_115010:309-758(+)